MPETDAPTMITITCPRCHFCKKNGSVEIPVTAWVEWNKAGRLPKIQLAFPMLSAAHREMMISGTHPHCWDQAFCTCGTSIECEVHALINDLGGE